MIFTRGGAHALDHAAVGPVWGPLGHTEPKAPTPAWRTVMDLKHNVAQRRHAAARAPGAARIRVRRYAEQARLTRARVPRSGTGQAPVSANRPALQTFAALENTRPACSRRAWKRISFHVSSITRSSAGKETRKVGASTAS